MKNSISQGLFYFDQLMEFGKIRFEPPSPMEWRSLNVAPNTAILIWNLVHKEAQTFWFGLATLSNDKIEGELELDESSHCYFSCK